jgi:glycosyltransferase involved in cell wall biosynthesis
MVSILLPVYNGEKYLARSIDSVLSQTFGNFELLIAFNGTTDGSRDIVRSYEDPRIRTFDYGMDKGKSKTLNRLLPEAQHGLMCLQDDDDVWMPAKLEKQVAIVDRFDVVGTMIEYIDELGEVTGRPDLAVDHEDIVGWSLAGINQVANTSAIFRTQDARDLRGWNEAYDGVEDYDFWLRLMRCGKRFHNIGECLVSHRIHGGSNFNRTNHSKIGMVLNG